MLSAARTASGISGRAFLHGDAKRRGSGQRVRGRQSNACERRPALQPQSFLQQSRHTLEPPSSLLASQRVCPASRSGGRPPSSRLSSAGLAELRALAVLRAASARTRPKPVVPSSLSYARPLPASDAAAGGGGGDAGEAPTSAGSSSARGSAGGAGMGKGATGGRLVRWWKRRAGRCIASGRRAGGRAARLTAERCQLCGCSPRQHCSLQSINVASGGANRRLRPRHQRKRVRQGQPPPAAAAGGRAGGSMSGC